MKKGKKVLIIKLGYSETLVDEVSRTTSLGDVLRSTVILPIFKDDHVTWLVDEQAVGLLKGNKYIDRLLGYDLTTVLQIQAESFDTVINLEKIEGVCALADSLKCKERYGFKYAPDEGEILAYDGSKHILELCQDEKKKVSNLKYWEELLFEMVNSTWNGEVPSLGYKPVSEVTYDIGFNSNVGSKWPTKAWPGEYWDRVEEMCGGRYTISRQKGLDSLEEYIDWINSCRLIITNDSLGLHIGHALGKKIVSMFGPTLASEVYVKDGVKLLPEGRYDCMPCMSTECTETRSCMYDIMPERVFKEVERLLDED